MACHPHRDQVAAGSVQGCRGAPQSGCLFVGELVHGIGGDAGLHLDDDPLPPVHRQEIHLVVADPVIRSDDLRAAAFQERCSETLPEGP